MRGAEDGSIPTGASALSNFRRRHGAPIVYTDCNLVDGGFHSTKGRTPAQQAGLRYERKVYEYLKNYHRCFAQVSVFFSYGSMGKYNRIVPDLLIADNHVDQIICCEIKRQHTGEAKEQLAFYRPVLEKHFKNMPIFLLEICHSLPPRGSGANLNILQDRHSLYDLARDKHNVLVLTDRELRLGLGSLNDGSNTGVSGFPLR